LLFSADAELLVAPALLELLRDEIRAHSEVETRGRTSIGRHLDRFVCHEVTARQGQELREEAERLLERRTV
jgi:hypothetical protein